MYPISFQKNYFNLLLRFYPRYDNLKQEMLKFFYRNALEQRGLADIYIDLNSFLSSLYKRMDYTNDDPMTIASSIINLAAHMRNFFATRFGISTRIFLIYGNTRPLSAASIIPEYNAHTAMDMEVKQDITLNIEENLNIVELLAQYIPEVYYVRSNETEPAVIMRSIMKIVSAADKKNKSFEGHRVPRFVMTKDMLTYQIVCCCNNTHVIRPKKSSNNDVSYTISYFDFYRKLSAELSLKNPIGEGISPELYSFYMSLAGCKDRGIRSASNYPVTDNLIKGLISSGTIINGYNIRPSIDPSFSSSVGINEEVGFENRFRALDLLHQEIIFSASPTFCNIGNSLVNLYDPDAVRQINNQYFRKYPLDLNVL